MLKASDFCIKIDDQGLPYAVCVLDGVYLEYYISNGKHLFHTLPRANRGKYNSYFKDSAECNFLNKITEHLHNEYKKTNTLSSQEIMVLYKNDKKNPEYIKAQKYFFGTKARALKITNIILKKLFEKIDVGLLKTIMRYNSEERSKMLMFCMMGRNYHQIAQHSPILAYQYIYPHRFMEFNYHIKYGVKLKKIFKAAKIDIRFRKVKAQNTHLISPEVYVFILEHNLFKYIPDKTMQQFRYLSLVNDLLSNKFTNLSFDISRVQVCAIWILKNIHSILHKKCHEVIFEGNELLEYIFHIYEDKYEKYTLKSLYKRLPKDKHCPDCNQYLSLYAKNCEETVMNKVLKAC